MWSLVFLNFCQEWYLEQEAKKQVSGICTKNRTLASCDNRVLDSIESSWADSYIKGQKCSDILRIYYPLLRGAANDIKTCRVLDGCTSICGIF